MAAVWRSCRPKPELWHIRKSTYSQVVERDTRDAQNVVPQWACEFDSRLGYSFCLQVRQVPSRVS